MVNPSININKNTILQAAIISIIWGLTQYFIRLGLNPDVKANLASYQKDTMYGILAVFAAVMAYFIIAPRFNLTSVI